MTYFYYFMGERLGPVNADQLRALVRQGIINPDTIIESGAKRVLASKVTGLFPPPVPDSVPVPTPPVQPSATKQDDPKPEPDEPLSVEETIPQKASPVSEETIKRNIRKTKSAQLLFACHVVDTVFLLAIALGIIVILIGITVACVHKEVSHPSIGYHSIEMVYPYVGIGLMVIGSGISALLTSILFYWIASFGFYYLSVHGDIDPPQKT